MRISRSLLLFILILPAAAVLPSKSVSSEELFSPHELLFSTSYLDEQPSFSLNLTIIRTERNGTGSEILELQVERVAAIKSTITASHPDVTVTETGVSTRKYQILLPATIKTGTSLSISIRGWLTTQDGESASAAVSSSRNFQLISAEVFIPAGSSILGIQPAAHIREEEQQWTKLRWNYVNKRFVSYSIAYLPPFDSSKLRVSFQSIDRKVTEGEEVRITLKVTYSGSTPVLLDLITPRWFRAQRDGEGEGGRRVTFRVRSTSEVTIVLTAKGLETGKYQGDIYILHKGEIVLTLPVEFEVTPSPTIPLLLVLLPSLALIGIGVYRMKKRREQLILEEGIEKEIAELRGTSVERRGSITADFPMVTKIEVQHELEPSPDFLALETLMEPRDVQILEFIHDNKGTSQQAISDALGISKATLSRAVRRLVERGLVAKETNGMSNRLYLKYEKLPKREAGEL